MAYKLLNNKGLEITGIEQKLIKPIDENYVQFKDTIYRSTGNENEYMAYTKESSIKNNLPTAAVGLNFGYKIPDIELQKGKPKTKLAEFLTQNKEGQKYLANPIIKEAKDSSNNTYYYYEVDNIPFYKAVKNPNAEDSSGISYGKLKVIKYPGDNEPQLEMKTKENVGGNEIESTYSLNARIKGLNQMSKDTNIDEGFGFNYVSPIKPSKPITTTIPDNKPSDKSQPTVKETEPTYRLPKEYIDLWTAKTQGKETPVQFRTYKPTEGHADVLTSALKGAGKAFLEKASKDVSIAEGEQDMLRAVKKLEELQGRKYTKPEGKIAGGPELAEAKDAVEMFKQTSPIRDEAYSRDLAGKLAVIFKKMKPGGSKADLDSFINQAGLSVKDDAELIKYLQQTL